ncbi:MAG: DNA primase large subunit PriL [Candidatus Bathyarchaeota archaeon]|nr:DNA primase large subunit PriL [Candidatus Bathyarchaeota archaeon]
MEIADLESPEYKPILERAQKRIEEAILFGSIKEQSQKDDIEIPSFPIAVLMIAATNDRPLKRRYALAEAKRASELLKDEDTDMIVGIAENFDWKIKPIQEDGQTYDLTLHFTDFLKNAANLHSKKWKLVNRKMLNGEVYLTKTEASRLLEEEVRRHIEEKLDIKVGSLPDTITKRVDQLNQLFSERKAKIKMEELPKEVVIPAFPPCIKRLYDAISSGRNISHIGRFALTSFLVNVGMTTENVTNLFRVLPDFRERLTRYQVEHIAGRRGSRTKYIPPKCETLQTHGVCQNEDEICKKIRHPLIYYRRKIRAVKT